MPVTLTDIQDAIFARVKAAVDAGSVLPVKYEDKAFDHFDKPYAEMIITPEETQSETVDGGDLLSGYLIFNVYFKHGNGTHEPAREAQKFLDLFPRDSVLFGDLSIDGTGTIHRSRDASAARDGWRYTPTIIKYSTGSCSA